MTVHNVAILSYNGATLFELGCAVELFGLPRPEFEKWYQSRVVTFDTGLLQTTAGLLMQVGEVDNLNGFDTLVVPSWPTDYLPVPETLANAVLDFVSQDKRIITFCSGAFLLAKLGLLDGKSATTHWLYADTFKARFPNVAYKDDVLYLFNGQFGCSAGSAAALDLGLEVIRQDFGSQAANSVARRLVLSAHRKGGQSQFAETPVMRTSSQFSFALDWAVKHLNLPLDIDTLAKKANMSRRTFDRKFRANLNLSPKEWITEQRLQLAKSLLEQKELNMDQVAQKTGFEQAGTLRHHFRKNLGISPSQYRQQFLVRE